MTEFVGPTIERYKDKLRIHGKTPEENAEFGFARFRCDGLFFRKYSAEELKAIRDFYLEESQKDIMDFFDTLLCLNGVVEDKNAN